MLKIISLLLLLITVTHNTSYAFYPLLVCSGSTYGSSWAGLTDDFTRADDDSLGSNWTEVTGDTDIVSSTASMMTSPALVVLTSTQDIASGTITSQENQEGSAYSRMKLVFWYEDSSNYWYAELYNSVAYVKQVVSGTPNTIATSSNISGIVSSTTYQFGVTFDATDIVVSFDSTDVLTSSGTYSGHSGNLGFGIERSTITGYFDSWQGSEN